jgi:hypothetical protein
MKAASRQPEFSFAKDYPVSSRPRRKTQRGKKHQTAEIKRQALRSKCARRIINIVETVADRRNVPWKALFDSGRGTNAASSARVLAMGLCCALDIPQYMVARSFRRSWATVFLAEKRCSKLYRESARFRKEWDSISEACAPTPKKRS